MIKAIIFDMNGVISDDEPIHELAFHETCQQFKVNLTHELFIKLCLGKTDLDGLNSIIKYFKLIVDSKKLLEIKTKKYLKLAPSMIKTFPDLVELVKKLHKKYFLAIASGSLAFEIYMALRIFKIEHYFRIVTSAEDMHHGKPDPEPYLRTAKKLKLSPKECLVIEDSISGIASAKQASMYCIAITNTYPKSELLKADKIVDSFSEINEKLINSLEE